MLRLLHCVIVAIALIFTTLAYAEELTYTEDDILRSITPEQQGILLALDTTTQPSRELVDRALNSLSGDQRKMLDSLLPGVKVTTDLVLKAYEIIYNDKLSVEERISQLQEIAGVNASSFKIERTICIWDPVGRAGPIFQAAQDQQTRMSEFGISIKLRPYTDESIVLADLKGNVCDAALISGMRARQLNRFSGTVDAIGAITDKEQMKTLLYLLSRPATAKHMVQGPFATLGIAQAGAAYIFVDDRKINTLGKAAGKKVAVLGYDPVQAEMVAAIGATPEPSTMISAPNKFNNGVVNVLAAPLVAYNAMELYKGMTPNGGIINYPLAQISMQLIGWRHRIPNIAGQLVRETFFNNYDKIDRALNTETENIPDKWWIEIPERDKGDYDKMMQQARITLRDNGYYDSDLLTIQRKIRCKFSPEHEECTNPVE